MDGHGQSPLSVLRSLTRTQPQKGANFCTRRITAAAAVQNGFAALFRAAQRLSLEVAVLVRPTDLGALGVGARSARPYFVLFT